MEIQSVFRKIGPYDFGEQHRRNNILHALVFMQEKPVPKSSDEGCQRKAGEVCADGKQRCPDDIGNQPHQTRTQRPQKDACKNDGNKGKANLQIPEIDGKETGTE